MNKIFFAVGLTAAAVAFVPATVNAHSYEHDAEHVYNEAASYDHEYAGYSWWDEKRCERIGFKLDKLSMNFDQNNDRRLDRQQQLIDRQSEKECPVEGTIVDELVSDGNFTTLVTAVQAADLAGALSAPGELTVFAPTDQAFANLPEGTVEALLVDIPALTAILTNHVVSGKVNAATAEEIGVATALNGKELNIYAEDGSLYVNDSRIVLRDIMTSNGIIHVIDAVIVE